MSIIFVLVFSLLFIFRRINKIFNINENLIAQKTVKFDIDGFEKIKYKLDIK